MKTRKAYLLPLCLVTFALTSCKREKLEVDQDLAAPGKIGIESIGKTKSLREQQEANSKALEELDRQIEELSQELNQSQNLSAEQKAELSKKIANAQNERLALQQKQKDLEDLLSATQKALDEAKKRNEELKKELENAKKGQTPEPTAPGGTNPGPAPAPAPERVGPFAITIADRCIGVKDKSTADKAPLSVATCAFGDNELFFIEEATAEGDEFRIIASHSEKCMTLSGTGLKVGDQLQQEPCQRKDSALSERFFLIGINDVEFVLQSAQTEMCIVAKEDGSLIQDKCTDATTIYRLSKKPVK